MTPIPCQTATGIVTKAAFFGKGRLRAVLSAISVATNRVNSR